jgi:hypothetical protein
MDTAPLIERGINDTQPLTAAALAAASSAGREAVSYQTDIDRKRGAVEYPSAAGIQSEGEPQALFEVADLEALRSRWGAIQTGFVDDPGGAVKQADELVTTVMKRLAEVFTAERTNLEKASAEGEDVSTEDLRVALRRYRSFFDRLLCV